MISLRDSSMDGEQRISGKIEAETRGTSKAMNVIMKSRMRESRTYGFVRGWHCGASACSNGEEQENGI